MAPAFVPISPVMVEVPVLETAPALEKSTKFSTAPMFWLTVTVLDTEAIVLPQVSVAVQISVIVPPQVSVVVVNVDGFEVPLIKQFPLNPFVNDNVLAIGSPPQGIVIVTGPGTAIVGRLAGLTVIILETVTIGLPHLSVAVHVSVTIPPQAS